MSVEFKAFPDRWDWDSVVEHVIVHYRWVFVMFLLPVSLVYDIYHAVRSYVIFKLNSAPKQHKQKVSYVQSQVRHWKDTGADRPMCTARPGKAQSSESRTRAKFLISLIWLYTFRGWVCSS